MSIDKKTTHILDYITVGGQKLRTAIWKGNGNKTPLLFFNGVGANLEIAQPLADLLSDRDIITFDMPGVGGSPDPTFPYRPWWVAKAAKEILEKHNYHTVDVMGISWGGGAAQQFAMQYRKRVNRLVLVATSTGALMVPGNPAALSKMADPKRYIDRSYLAKNFKTLYGEDSKGAKEFSANMTAPSVRGYLFQLAAMAGWTSVPFLRFLRHETLIMMGDRDHIVPLANGHILKFMIPNSRLHVVEDGGHLFLLSRAEEVLPVLTEFLDGDAVAPLPTSDFAAAAV